MCVQYISIEKPKDLIIMSCPHCNQEVLITHQKTCHRCNKSLRSLKNNIKINVKCPKCHKVHNQGDCKTCDRCLSLLPIVMK